MQDFVQMTDASIEPVKIPVSMPCAAAVRSAPFARIALGDRAFQVCDRDDIEGGLAFRPEAGGTWLCLSHSLEDGWLRIGADILQSDPDALRHFMSTHAVRQHGWYRCGDEIVFDTLGTPWTVRKLDATHAEVTLGDAPARQVDPAVATAEDPREQAIEVLIAAYPDLAERFGPEIDHWAVRLASGGVVTPMF